MSKNSIGRQAEKLAAAHLKQKGFNILATNYRTSIGEIDIVACDHHQLVIVEVRSKSASLFCRPEESINSAKADRLIKLAELYCQQHPETPEDIRIDVVAIYFDHKGGLLKLNHINNAIEKRYFF